MINARTYHIVWTTYGTWLPGDRRGWVKSHCQGIQEPNPRLECSARGKMEEDAVQLTAAQQSIVESTIQEHCQIRKWDIQALNVRTNHVHLVVTADRVGDEIMKQLKAWCSRRLSDADGLRENVAFGAGRRRWFTEGGRVSVIHGETYLANAVRYVNEGQ